LGWILPASSSSYLSSKETNMEKVSLIGVVMQWYNIILKVTVFIRKQNVDARYDVL
jgi:hypothetical protein